MTLEKTARDGTGRRYHSAAHYGNSQEAKLARLAERQLARGPGSPGSWPRLLAAHARWILGITLTVVAVAAAFAATQPRLYRSQADVIVQPSAAAAGSSSQQPDMSTEESVVTSGLVLTKAARDLGVPVSALSKGVSVKAQGVSYVLQITYSNQDRYVAQRRAQAIAQAYTAFRSAGETTAPVATLITPAALATSPYSPSYPLDVGVAVLAGLVLALTTAWGRDYLDDRLRGPLDLEQQAAADVLGMIPAYRASRQSRGHLATAASPGSMVAEAYRGLRTRVLLTAEGRDTETILVTSPAWEDRGAAAANLAAALAQSGRSTVLVCADPHWGRAHLLVGRRGAAPGLTELLQQRTDTIGALQATSVPGLRLLAPGAPARDSGALLGLPSLRTMLEAVRAQADAVVIEAPPLLVSPDVRPLAGCARRILLIADARTSTRTQVQAAVRELRQVGVGLNGCVLINVGRRRRLRPGHLPPAGAPGTSAPSDEIAEER